MKKFFLFLCALVAVSSLSSCLDSGTDYSISKEQQKSYLDMIALSAGGYNARIGFANGQYYHLYDSVMSHGVHVGMRSSDSTLTVSYFPLAKLDSLVRVDSNDSTSLYRKVFDAIKQSTTRMNLSGQYYIWTSQYISNNTYTFLMPLTNYQTKLYYDGAEHNVLFCMNGSGANNAGYYTTGSTSATMYVYVSNIYLDFESNAKPGVSLREAGRMREGLIYLTEK